MSIITGMPASKLNMCQIFSNLLLHSINYLSYKDDVVNALIDIPIHYCLVIKEIEKRPMYYF